VTDETNRTRKEPDAAPKRPRRKRRRGVRRLVIGLLLLLILLPLAGLLALRSSTVRRTVLERSAAAIAARTGLSISTEDFALHPTTGAIELSGIQLCATEGAPPFLTVNRLEADLRWRTLVAERVSFRAVRIDGIRFDPAAPLPATRRTGRARKEFTPPPLDVQRLEVVAGAVAPTEVPPEFTVWLDGWHADDIRLHGSYLDGRLDVEELTASLTTESARRPPVEATLRAALSLGRWLDYDLRDFDLQADGLALEGHATGRLGPLVADRMNLVLDARPARLFPDLTTGGHVVASADLELSRPGPVLAGSLRATADDVPAELFQPWLERVADLAGTHLDVEADLGLDLALTTDGEPGPRRAVVGNAQVVWRRQRERLVAGSIRSLPIDADHPDRGVQLAIEADVLPALAGSRRLRGGLVAPDWPELSRGRLEQTRLDLRVPDLDALVQSLGLFPQARGSWQPAAELVVTAEANGPLLAPELSLRALWEQDGERLAVVSAETVASEADHALRFTFDATLLPDSPGRRHGAGDFSAPGWHALRAGELHDVRVELRTPDVARALDRLETAREGLFPGWSVPFTDRWPTQAAVGSLDAELDISGPLAGLDIDTDATWRPAAGELVRLQGRGRPLLQAPYVAGPASLHLVAVHLDLSRFARHGVAAVEGARAGTAVSGRLNGLLRLDGSPQRCGGRFSVRNSNLRIGKKFALDALRLDGVTDCQSVEITDLAASIPHSDSGRLRGTGRAELSWPPGRAELHLEATRPLPDVDRATLALSVEGGTLHVEPLEIEDNETVARFGARVPLRSLAPLWRRLGTLPLPAEPGPMHVSMEGLDLGTALDLFGLPRHYAVPDATLDGAVAAERLEIDSATGTFLISKLTFYVNGRPLRAEQDFRLEIADARVTLSPVRLHASGPAISGRAPLDLSGYVQFDPDWRPGDGARAIIRDLALDVDGTVAASVFDPLLLGRGSGPLSIEGRARGRPGALTARVKINGPEASYLFPIRYATKFEAPEIELTLDRDGLRVETARARLNGGNVVAHGATNAAREFVLQATLEHVRYRLDYGLVAVLGGHAELNWPPPGSARRRRISGRLLLERGALRRNVNLDREVLRVMFEPGRRGGANPLLESFALDVTITTAEGVTITNNVADLHARWTELGIGGTLATPLLTGDIDVDPGGRVFAFGQVFRIDQCVLSWAGEEPSQARVELETTSSLQDPTLRQRWRQAGVLVRNPGSGGMLDLRQQQTGMEAWESLGEGMMDYFGNKLAGAVGGSSATVSYEPLPLFGETDTAARFTLSFDASPNTTFIASTNPREAEGQTYIVDLHNFPVLPSFRAQVFTLDNGNPGATLQQTRTLGRTRVDADVPRIRKIRVDVPAGVKKRRVRRAIPFRKGDPFHSGSDLDVEIDVAEALQRQGYPAANVRVGVEPAEKPGIELGVGVEAGHRVEFVFEGVKLPKRARRAIAAEYRPAELEAEASLEGVVDETMRELRSQGYPHPVVAARVEPINPADPAGPRAVRVQIEGGRRIDPEAPRIVGVPQGEAAELAARFASRASRVELAAGLPGADRFLLQSLEALAWPGAQVVSRELSENGEQLTVNIDPGARQRIVSIEITGVDGRRGTQLARMVEEIVGETPRIDRIARAGRRIEDELKSEGHATAQVRPRVEDAGGQRPQDVVLHYDITPGPNYVIDEVRYEGLEGSARKWVEKTVRLEPGEVLQPSELAGARRRLYQTGVFQRVQVSQEAAVVGGSSTVLDEPLNTRITFKLEEAPRYWLSYGARYESGPGLGLVVDAVDRNSLGRGHTTGIRGIYGNEQRSLRLYHIIPRLVGPRSTLGRQTIASIVGEGSAIASGDLANTVEFWAQLTFPVSRRNTTRFYTVFQHRNLDLPDIESLDARVISPRLGWQWAYNTVDQALGVGQRKGLFLGLDVSGSHTALGSDVSLLALFTSFRFFQPLPGGFVWAQNWRTGQLDAKDEGIPFVDRLRVGGEFSVRGYPTNSLGPLGCLDPGTGGYVPCDDGVALGGELRFIVNQELHRELGKGVVGVLFFDAGNVWPTRRDVSFDLFTSTGVGARYMSPVGPLRLDLAFPLQPREGDASYKVYIGFGNIF